MLTLVAERGTGEPISLGGALMAGKKVAPDATLLLADDHRTVLGWFDWFQRAEDTPAEAAIGRRICVALLAHMVAEEEIFYPAAAEATGDKALVAEAIREHEDAKALIADLQKARTVGVRYRERMRALAAEIAHHVDEEENRLFPAVRDSGMDLYHVGRLVAARRVDALFNMVGRAGAARAKLSEVAPMPVSKDEARDFFLLGLKNAHAAASQGQTMLEMQVRRLDDYPDVKAALKAHVKNRKVQLKRLETLLDSHGESRSALKEAALDFAAGIAGMANAAADDEVLKNSFAGVAQARFLAAAYESLLVLGEAAGEVQALRPIQQCLSEERALATFLEENLRGTATRFLALRSAAAG
jgi:ferritin-like metal-binding protein YciE/hemerythrin superfamily protein